MNIQEELRISGYQSVAFMADTDMRDLYRAMVEHWCLSEEGYGGAFAASMFYNLGRVHGIRDERARRKGRAAV